MCEHSHIVYGMVWQMSIYIGLALFTKVSNALNTLISGKKPGFQTLSKGLIHCSPAVRGGCPARSSRPWGRAQRMLGVQQWIADVVCYDCYAQYKTRPIVADVRWSVCLSGHNHWPTKTTEPIEMPFETWTRVDPRKGILFNIILSGDQDPHGERGNFFGGGHLPAHCEVHQARRQEMKWGGVLVKKVENGGVS